MERQIILHRPWTCRWGRFGYVMVPGRETTSGVFWSCAHPALPDGPKVLGPDMCTECPRWTASSRLRTTRAGTGARLRDGEDRTGGLHHRLIRREPGRSTSTRE